ncbi:ThiF family adenylyltransferase [Bradyrhizobium barranii subsp. barranii]|uniref:ThiF family adenylyltransferase n=1 Tax=Bradyrhizobium barranii subsp. barranii TaxID=2823807 RepID=A0A939LXM8_9BRAD|nr:ThiF family adenylyltransferase [Bradyrhizobium barranii subsp. barranii]
MPAGFISESWPASNRNDGRLQVGIPGRNKSESAVLVDGGTVERENIGQSGFACDDIGRLKGDVAADRVRRINPEVQVQTFACRDNELEDLNAVLRNADLIIDGTDSLSAAMRLSRAAFQLGIDALHIRTEGDNRQYVIAGTLRNAPGLGCAPRVTSNSSGCGQSNSSTREAGQGTVSLSLFPGQELQRLL